MLVLLKNHLNYLKDSIFKCFLKKYNRLLFIYFIVYLFIYLLILIFSQHVMMESLRLEKQNIIKDIRSLFRLKTKN